MQKFNKQSFIRDLLNFSPRQGKKAEMTGKYLEKTLKYHKVSFLSEKFKVEIPEVGASLAVDGKKIPCKGCSFIGGEIKSKNSIASSLISSRLFANQPNINFNPECDDISAANFYFSPAVAVSRKNITAIIQANKILGKVSVKKVEMESNQILVGNTSSPKNIIFGHYDSIGSGATDNASGVAVMIDVLVKNPTTSENNLFVFDGNEELSYDRPTYWGHGYRVFEERHGDLLKRAHKIFVVDCVGNGKMFSTNDPEIINLAFPISSAEKLKDKIHILSGDIKKLMKVYHSNLDTEKELSVKYLNEAVRLLLKQLK
ncbi:MAG: M28 family peptidase [Candidatus Pacebacteria bacterium]|nr:M28 family peptidase [Candidatus Paceibacterota bacterium]NUQ57462.1 M28 family peptidase [Candidatus Paceibacter sp.]